MTALRKKDGGHCGKRGQATSCWNHRSTVEFSSSRGSTVPMRIDHARRVRFTCIASHLRVGHSDVNLMGACDTISRRAMLLGLEQVPRWSCIICAFVPL